MEEYVAKSVLKKELNISNLHSGIIDALQNIVDEIPAADVQEVKHAHWYEHIVGTEITDPILRYYVCSNCDVINDRYTTYCPWCGAKMDEEENDE